MVKVLVMVIHGCDYGSDGAGFIIVVLYFQYY